MFPNLDAEQARHRESNEMGGCLGADGHEHTHGGEKNWLIKRVDSELAVAEMYCAEWRSCGRPRAAAEEAVRAAQNTAMGYEAVASSVANAEAALKALGAAMAVIASNTGTAAINNIAKTATAYITYTTAAATSGQISNALSKMLNSM